MANPADTFLTYDAAGIREDLSDVIKNISPTDTLFFSSLGEGGADQRKVEWQTDALASATANAAVEGDTESEAALTATTRVYNNCQIQKKVFRISNTMDKVKKAGRVSEVDYQTAKKGKELAKDVEYAFLREVRVDGAEATAPKMRGILNWVTTNLNKAADGTLEADGTITGGTGRALTETILKANLATVFNAGGNVSLAYCDSTQKQAISGLSQATSNYRVMVEEKTMNAAVDVYVSDFGSVAIKAHRGMPAGVILILDPAHKGKKATLRAEHREQLGKTGDNQLWVIRVEHSLRDLAESAHGRITNLT